MIFITTKYIEKASSMSHIFADFKRCSKMMGEHCNNLLWLFQTNFTGEITFSASFIEYQVK